MTVSRVGRMGGSALALLLVSTTSILHSEAFSPVSSRPAIHRGATYRHFHPITTTTSPSVANPFSNKHHVSNNKLSTPSKSHTLLLEKAQDEENNDEEAARVAAMSDAITTTKKKPRKASLAALLRFVSYHAKLIYVAAVVSLILEIPKCGLGANFRINMHVLRVAFVLTSAFLTIPLFFMDNVKQLSKKNKKDTTKQNRTPLLIALALMGGRKKKTTTAILTATMIGGMVSLSEELLFRGILQTTLGRWVGTNPAILLQSIAFGYSHDPVNRFSVVGAVTGVVGAVFGRIYATSQNLAVPIICHALYNAINLFRAHQEVTRMSRKELEELVAI